MGNSSVTNLLFCGASLGIVDEDDDEPPPQQRQFVASDNMTKEESENSFLTEFTTVLREGISVKTVSSKPPHRGVHCLTYVCFRPAA